MNKSRVEAFSDGVFAFAITLLVVTIAQPEDYRRLAHELARRWPSLAAYVVSFAVIGIMWLNHHSVFGHFDRVDRGLVYLNLFLLMTVAFLPFPTGVLGQALARGQGERTAAVVYGATMTANGAPGLRSGSTPPITGGCSGLASPSRSDEYRRSCSLWEALFTRYRSASLS